MEKLIAALGSKKLLLTVGGIITAVTTPGLTPMQRMESIIALIIGYCGAQGLVDAAQVHGSDAAEAAKPDPVTPPK